MAIKLFPETEYDTCAYHTCLRVVSMHSVTPTWLLSLCFENLIIEEKGKQALGISCELLRQIILAS